jgi:cobalt-zinc-cadmium efflux system outer membrane protein
MTLATHQRLALAITIAGSSLVTACGSTRSTAAYPQPEQYASAELVEPYVPTGEPVDPDAASALSLDQLLVFADQHSPVVRTARARVGLADAELVGAKILFPANPVVRFAGGRRTVGNASGFEFEGWVQQQLEIAGERGLRIDAARDQQRLREAAVNEVRWSLHVEVHRLVATILVVRQRLAQAERFVALSQSLRDIAGQQVEAGESAPIILLVADADLARTREAVIQARQAIAALEVRLAAVIGWPEETLPPIEEQLPPVRAAPDAASLLSMMAEFHPSLRARELAVVAAHSRAALEARDGWPEPVVRFGYGREAGPAPEPDAEVWLLHVLMPIPLWHRNQEARARAEAELQVAGGERDATATRLRGELLQAATALDAAAERVALYETDVVPQLEENLALLQRAYELGEVDVHQVSQTRERLLTATGQYIDALVTYYETAATLEGLVGTELWTEMEATP